MQFKKLITFTLLFFVAVSVGYLIWKNARVPLAEKAGSEIRQSLDIRTEGTLSKEPGSDSDNSGLPAENKIIAQYFHGTMRCDTCNAIEDLTKEALNTKFEEELESNKLEFQSINVDEPENGHFVEDYQLTSRTVVIIRFMDGRPAEWKRLDKAWPLVINGERAEFIKYVQEETRNFLEKSAS